MEGILVQGNYLEYNTSHGANLSTAADGVLRRNRLVDNFSRPGKPTDNCYVETFNGSLRDECLNVHWFETMEDAKAIIEGWRREYNESRPHMALKDAPPQEYARSFGPLNAEN